MYHKEDLLYEISLCLDKNPILLDQFDYQSHSKHKEFLVNRLTPILYRSSEFENWKN